jgi:hypothetical protein
MIKDKGGRLIPGPYRNMAANRPIPWIGMPVLYFKNWGFVDREDDDGFAAIRGFCRLSSYRDYGSFCLPGEPDAVPMNEAFCDRLVHTYGWGTPVRYIDGLWRELSSPTGVDEASLHTVLFLPHGVEMSVVLPNNDTQSSEDSKPLKGLNTDGRATCARCSSSLKPCWLGNVNLSYCPACEG